MKPFRRVLAVFALSGASLAAWFGVNSLVADVRFARATQEVEVNCAELAKVQDLGNVRLLGGDGGHLPPSPSG